MPSSLHVVSQEHEITRDSFESDSQITGLAYIAKDLQALQSGLTGQSLADQLKLIANIREVFATDAEIVQFSSEYSFIRAQGTESNSVGPDVVAFRSLSNNAVQLGVAGVGPIAELLQTYSYTNGVGFNDGAYAPVRDFYLGLVRDFPSSVFDFMGHSLGGQIIQLLAAETSLGGLNARIATITTFGAYGINFAAAGNLLIESTVVPNFRQLLLKLDDIENTLPIVHFENDSDKYVPDIPQFWGLAVRHAGSFKPVDLLDGLTILNGLQPHDNTSYIRSLGDAANNVTPVISNPSERPDAAADLSGLYGISADSAEEIVVTARRLPNASKEIVVTGRRAQRGSSQLTTFIDPQSGAYVPQGIDAAIIGGKPFYTDRFNEETKLIISRDAQGKSYVSGSVSGSEKITVVRSFAVNGKLLSTDLNGRSFAGVDFASAGGVIGSVLGYRLAGNNQLAGVVYSAALKTLGDNLGDTLDRIIGGKSVGKSVEGGFEAVGQEFLANFKAAGIGAVSSLLTAELINALGLSGFAGEIANSAGGAVIGQIATNLTKIAAGGIGAQGVTAFSNVGVALGSAAGSKLAALVWQPDTIGGQIGAAVGSAIGTIAAVSVLVAGSGASATLLGVQLGALAGPVGAAIGAFVGFLIGGLIGSLFGGTPRSGADSQWDATQQKFVVSNVYARKGGSQDAARGVASAVSETFNSILSAAGGKLLNPEAVQSGNYGMRKKDFVYRPYSTQDADAITQRFSGKNSPQQLIGYGIYQGLVDSDFQIAGGNVYVKRAIYATLTVGGIDPLNFDSNTLFGNISSAQNYGNYLANPAAINALVVAKPDSVFAAETALTLARADELGLTRRHQSDWYGGYTTLLQDAAANAATAIFSFDYDPAVQKISRSIGVGNFTMADAVDIAGQTVIQATTVNNIIDLRTKQLADQRGYTVDGKFNDDIAVTTTDFTALSTSVVEARVLNRDVGFIRIGQEAAVKLEAFPFTRFGSVPGRVRSISRDAVQDKELGLIYTATIILDRNYVDTDGRRMVLSPGLAATVDVRTGSRRIISYLISPLQRSISQAGRER